ncbi:conserved hypothetical protein [Trichinella spiralis]|uniref:hypothetical protein n=1 Tax=Trichinella spiralis TaxID=6334 RepID=UPI0001EFBCAC|nr:conserved hypothetical protein [Trichinella spiralis]
MLLPTQQQTNEVELLIAHVKRTMKIFEAKQKNNKIVFILGYLGVCLISICESALRQNVLGGIGYYETEVVCRETCIGDHDEGCVRLYLNRWNCRCQANYYSNAELCYQDCGYNAYWNVFIYGECIQTPSQYGGACTTFCIHRAQGWTIFFVIVIFIAAVIVIIMVLPLCYWNHRTYRMMKKSIVSSMLAAANMQGKTAILPA